MCVWVSEWRMSVCPGAEWPWHRPNSRHRCVARCQIKRWPAILIHMFLVFLFYSHQRIKTNAIGQPAVACGTVIYTYVFIANARNMFDNFFYQIPVNFVFVFFVKNCRCITNDIIHCSKTLNCSCIWLEMHALCFLVVIQPKTEVLPNSFRNYSTLTPLQHKMCLQTIAGLHRDGSRLVRALKMKKKGREIHLLGMCLIHNAIRQAALKLIHVTCTQRQQFQRRRIVTGHSSVTASDTLIFTCWSFNATTSGSHTSSSRRPVSRHQTHGMFV